MTQNKYSVLRVPIPNLMVLFRNLKNYSHFQTFFLIKKSVLNRQVLEFLKKKKKKKKKHEKLIYNKAKVQNQNLRSAFKYSQKISHL